MLNNNYIYNENNLNNSYQNYNSVSLKDTLQQGFSVPPHYVKQPKLKDFEKKQDSVCSIGDMNNSESAVKHKNPLITKTLNAVIVDEDLNKAFSYVKEYVAKSSDSWHIMKRLKDDKNVFMKFVNSRFEADYIEKTKIKLKHLKTLKTGHIEHWVLTIPNNNLKNFQSDYRKLKDSINPFVKELRRLLHNPNIEYLDTYEVTQEQKNNRSNNVPGRLHQHIHLLLFGLKGGKIPYRVFMALKKYWHKLTGSGYDYLKPVPPKVNIFNYVMKYVTKEFYSINLTSVLLFAVGGESYTMSRGLSKLTKNDIKEDDAGVKYKYLCSFNAKTDNPFLLFDVELFDKSNLTWFFSFFPKAKIDAWLADSRSKKEQILKNEQAESEKEQQIREYIKANTIKIM